MELTPPGVFRKALGDLSPNVGSPMRVGPTGSRNRLMGKILGGASGRENPMSPKREGKILIEPRPEELSANKELFKSPTKMSRMNNKSPNPKTPLGVSPNRAELGRTQLKLLKGGRDSEKKLTSTSNLVSSQAKKTRDIMMKKEYEVSFPAGAMGLELEPVIISTERKIGCRVKDFYFGLGYSGIEPSILQNTIKVGDVVSSIDGVSMLSAPFMDILEVLTSKRENPRRSLTFKDISSQWSSSLSAGSRDEEDSHADLESHSMDVIPSHTSLSSNLKENSANVRTPVKKDSDAVPLTPETSPAVWKTYPATPDVFAPLPLLSQGTTPLLAHDATFTLTVSPKAVKALSTSGASCSNTPMKGGTAASLSKEVSREDLGRVLGRVGASIGYGLKGVGQKILEPFGDFEAKDRELSLMMGRKRELLSELSRSCVLLGAAEEKELDLQARLDEAKEEEIEAKKALVVAKDQLREAKDSLCRLEEQQGKSSEAGSQALADSQDTIIQLKATVSDLEASNDKLNDELEDWRAVVDENQKAYTTAQEELSTLRKEVAAAKQQTDIERSVRDQDQEEYKKHVEAVESEKASALLEMEQAVKEANERREAAEETGEKAIAEAEFLRETMGSERASVHNELQRVKGLLEELQNSHKEEILAIVEEREGVEATSRAAESDLRDLTQSLGANLETAVKEKDEAEALSYDLTLSVKKLRADLAVSQEALEEATRHQQRLRQCSSVYEYHLEKRTASLEALKASKDRDWKDFEAAMEEKTLEVSDLRAQLVTAGNDTVAIDTQLRRAREDREDLLLRFQSSSETKEESFHSALIDAQRVQDGLRIENEELTLKVGTLEDTIVEQLASMEQSQDKISSLLERVSSLESSSNDLQIAAEDYKVKAQAREKDLCSQLSQAEESMREGQDRLGMMRLEKEQETQQHFKALEESEAQVQSHEALWREEKERALVLEDQKAGLADELEAAQFAWETRNIDCETLESKLSSVETAKNEVEMQLVEERSSNSRAHEELKELLGLTEAQRGELGVQLGHERAKQRKCVETASKACEELSWELKDVRNSVLDLNMLEKEYVSTLRMVESKYGAVVASLEDKLILQGKEHAKEAEDFEQRIEHLTADRDTLLHSIESRTADTDEKMATTFTRAREAEKLLEAAYDEHEDLRKQISVLNLQVSKANNKVASLEGEMEFMQESANQSMQKVKDTLAFTEEQKFAVVHLRGELARQVQQIENMCTEKGSLEAQLSHTNEEHRIAVEEVDALNDLLRDTKNEYKKSKEEAQRKLDMLLESQRDLVAEQSKQEEHHLATLQAREEEAAKATAEALEVLGADFEAKQAMLLEEHGAELYNMQQRASNEAEKSREAQEQLVILEKSVGTLKEQKRKIENMLMSQDEALSVSEGRVLSLKEECEILEAARDKANGELAEVKSRTAGLIDLETALAEQTKTAEEAQTAVETFTQREQELVQQREDLMETLKSQHANLTAAVEDKDSALVAMRDEYSQILAQMESAVRSQRQAEAEAEARVVEVASLRARVSQITASNESNQDANMASQDVVKKMATNLSESKALLNESVTENRSLLEQREGLSRALREMKEQLCATEAERDAAREKSVFLESTVDQSSGSITSLSSRLEAVQRDYETKAQAKEAQIKQLGHQLAVANTATLSAQQQVAAKQAELEALHRQCTDLIAAAMASPESSPTKAKATAMRQAGYGHDEDEDEDEDVENDENAPRGAPPPFRAADKGQGSAPHGRGRGDRQVLGELLQAQAQTRAQTQADSADSEDALAISDLSSASQEAAVAGVSLAEAVHWHERLLSFALDMHEAITFATAEDFAAQEGIGETPRVSPPLRMASEALRALHDHVLLAPWLDSTAVAPQSLPAAHEMIDALRVPEERAHTASSSSSPSEEETTDSACALTSGGEGHAHAWRGREEEEKDMLIELSRARETIESLQQQLAEVEGTAIPSPNLVRQDSGATTFTISSSETGHSAISQSERIYSLVEDLEGLLRSRLSSGGLGLGLRHSQEEEGEGALGAAGADTSIDSLQLGGEGSMWRSLQQQASEILTHYRVNVMQRAVSKSSSVDRLGGGGSPRSRSISANSPITIPPRTSASYAETTADGGEGYGQGMGAVVGSSHDSDVPTYGHHVRLSSESADMPRLDASTDSLPRGGGGGGVGSSNGEDVGLEDVTVGKIIAMAEQHVALDTSFDSIDSQELHSHLHLLRPVAVSHSQSHSQSQNRGRALVEGEGGGEENDQDNSDEVEREDSGFWNVSAGSIDPLSDTEQSFEVA